MIIIIDKSLGQSYTFVAIRDGYISAYNKIQEILDAGHDIGGDYERVIQFVENSGYAHTYF